MLVDDAPFRLNGDGSARLVSEQADENPDDQPDLKGDDREAKNESEHQHAVGRRHTVTARVALR
jgi:hypothetical protein